MIVISSPNLRLLMGLIRYWNQVCEDVLNNPFIIGDQRKYSEQIKVRKKRRNSERPLSTKLISKRDRAVSLREFFDRSLRAMTLSGASMLYGRGSNARE